MANTTNFGWETPDDTDLVKDGAAAIRTLGSAIDTSLVDLKGGTTGQVLAKASNTDMDFTWATDASGIPPTIFDAKGDLIAASAADTAARLAVGTNGQYLSANSSTATGLEWITPPASGGYEVIATATPSAVSSFSFTSIPSTYKHLFILCVDYYQNNINNTTYMRLNNDSGSNYTYAGVVNSAGVLEGGGQSGQTGFGINVRQNGVLAASAGAYSDSGAGTIWIYDYANTSRRKSAQWSNFSRAVSTYAAIQNGMWNSTAAVNRIDIGSSGTITTGTFILYGVK